MVSDFDGQLLNLAESSAMTVTQGVDFDKYPFTSPHFRMGNYVAFIGQMNTAPNRLAVEWFIEHVLPMLPQNIKLKVIGACAPKLRRKLSQHPRVMVTGTVSSVAEACQDCFVGVAPVSVATGIQNKALEYFALGLPAIISSSVARGLYPASKTCFIQSGPAQEWAAEIIRLKAYPSGAFEMTKRARKYVETHHNWDSIGDGLRLQLLSMTSSSAVETDTVPQASAHISKPSPEVTLR